MRVTRWGLAICAVAIALSACKEEGTIRVHSLEFRGVNAVDQSRLRNALATKTSSKIPWGKKAYFDRSRFDADLKRVQAFYADRGYPDARVTGFDVKLNDKQDAVDLIVTIAEGEPVRVASIEFNGFEQIPPDHLNDLKSRIPLKVGEPRDRQLVVTAHEMAVNELKDHGFPYAKVTTAERNPEDDPKKSVLTFTGEAGTLAHFGPLEVNGNKSVSERVIERQLTFKPGDVYRRSLVQDSQRRLYGLALFQFVNIEPQNKEQQQAEEVPMRVTVAEGNHQRVNFSVGYGTEENARVDTEYHHVNFLGGARSAGVHARYSSLDRGLRLDFNQPYFFSPHFSFGTEAQQWYTYTPAYHSVVRGVKATFTHRQSVQTSWAVSLTNEYDSSTISDTVQGDPSLRNTLISLGLNPDTNEQAGTLNALAFDFQRSTADSLLDARHGYQFALHLEQAGRWVPGTFNYDALSVDARHYLPISGKVTFASRLQLGNIRPVVRSETPTGTADENVPFSKRYFLGGATSIRGWGRYEVSPLSDSGQPYGGLSMVAITGELRAPLRGNLGGVFFLDAGNVWSQSWGTDFTDLRYAIGPGIRYQTPIGPLRFDIGYQLNPIPGLLVNGSEQTRRWRMHFSIGQAF
jgi:outer membrane protein insertion porin family/translocation and assembly module TamA